MTDDPKFDAFLDALLRQVLVNVVGAFDESLADSYVPQIRAAVVSALHMHGYSIEKEKE
jgi:hypothetical protein